PPLPSPPPTPPRRPRSGSRPSPRCSWPPSPTWSTAGAWPAAPGAWATSGSQGRTAARGTTPASSWPSGPLDGVGLGLAAQVEGDDGHVHVLHRAEDLGQAGRGLVVQDPAPEAHVATPRDHH